jgi:serine protease Do
MGVAVADITPDIAEHLKLPAGTKGVVIADIEDGSPASEAGLQPGDIIQEVDRKPVHSIAEFRTMMTARGTTPVLLLVNREGHGVFAAVEVR